MVLPLTNCMISVSHLRLKIFFFVFQIRSEQITSKKKKKKTLPALPSRASTRPGEREPPHLSRCHQQGEIVNGKWGEEAVFREGWWQICLRYSWWAFHSRPCPHKLSKEVTFPVSPACPPLSAPAHLALLKFVPDLPPSHSLRWLQDTVMLIHNK